MGRFLRALHCALEGIAYGIRTQRHVRFHLLAALTAVSVGLFFRISKAEWLVLLLIISFVIAAELFNTALEALVDLVSPEYHPLAKTVKDTAAGAVLVAALAALVIGIMLFGPYLLCLVR